MDRLIPAHVRATALALAATALVSSTLLLAGCGHGEAATATATAMAPAAPQVEVAQVLARKVTDFDEFTGHFEAVQHVDVRPRVSGYIASVDFVQGHEVRKGDVLFVIDPRPYEDALRQARAQLAQARSQLELARSQRDRAAKLIEQHAISREDYDTRVASAEQAQANVEAAQANVDTAALNLSFTRVTAPISGVVGRAEVTAGNLVTSGQTQLTTLVSVDPIYVTFQGDEQSYLRYMALVRKSPRGAKHPVWVGLVDESGYPHQGQIVFLDNEIDATTGTVRARGELDNRDRLFTPGMFARVKLPGSAQYDAVLINDSAVGTDQSVKYVLKVGRDNTVEYRPVKLGPIVDGLRVVREGLEPGDTIVVNGLQRVRPGAAITPQRVAMGEGRSGDGAFPSDGQGLPADASPEVPGPAAPSSVHGGLVAQTGR
jgi:membrane fusion protein, multidrug efflux system